MVESRLHRNCGVLYVPMVLWAAHQPTPNCQIYVIDFQLYDDAIRFKFCCDILTH